MIKIILARFWVALLPFALYGLWLLFITHKAKDGHYIGEHIRKSALFWTWTSSALLLIVSCIWWSLGQAATGEASYSPAYNVNGKLVPAAVNPAKLNPAIVSPDAVNIDKITIDKNIDNSTVK